MYVSNDLFFIFEATAFKWLCSELSFATKTWAHAYPLTHARTRARTRTHARTHTNLSMAYYTLGRATLNSAIVRYVK